MERKSESIFDTMYIGKNIGDKFEDFSHPDLQFFSYLSCLLSIYDGNPLSFWEYSFVNTPLGSPYSVNVNEALNSLKSNHSVVPTTPGYYKLTDKGNSEIDFYLNLHAFKYRVKYLDTACKVLSLIPAGYIKNALHNEPVLSSAKCSISKKFLLDENSPATHSLYKQFGILREALVGEEYKELLVPAVVWIEALIEKDKELN